MNNAMHFTRHLNTNQCTFQRDERAAVIDVASTFCNPLFGTLLRSRCAIKIDLLCTLCRFGEQAYLIGLNLDKPPSDRQE